MYAYLEAYKEKFLEEKNMTPEEAEAEELDIVPPKIRYRLFLKKPFPQEGHLKKIIDQLTMEIEEEQKHYEVNTSKNLYVGRAFITFNNQNNLNKVINKMEITIIRALFNFFRYKILRCTPAKNDARYWEGKRVYVERAAEPLDVFWENLSVSTVDRVIKQMKTMTITVLILVAVFFVNLALSYFKQFLEDQARERGDDPTDILLMIVRVITFLTSLVVVAINVFLGRIVRILSAKEYHSTYTKYHLSVSFKLVLAMFVNTGLIPLFVNLGKENWFNSSGLIVDIFYNTLSVAFISPLMYLINPNVAIKKIKQWVERAKGEKSKMSQRQANALFEGPPLDMAQRFANTMLLLLLTLFYFHLLPILPLIAGLGAVWQFWIEKYVLLRRHKIPEVVGSTIALFFANSLGVIVFIWTLAVWGMTAELSDGKNFYPIIHVFFAFIYLVLPIRSILSKFVPDVEKNDTQLYEKERWGFLNDYDRTNPKSQKEAKLQFFKEMSEREDIGEEEKQNFQNQIQGLQ